MKKAFVLTLLVVCSACSSANQPDETFSAGQRASNNHYDDFYSVYHY